MIAKKNSNNGLLVDIRLKDFGQLIDVFPEAAQRISQGKNILEMRDANRQYYMGKDMHPEKSKTGARIGVYNNNGNFEVWVAEGWLDSQEKPVSATTSAIAIFQVSAERANSLLETLSTLQQKSSPEKE